jgi:hypothetical protein
MKKFLDKIEHGNITLAINFRLHATQVLQREIGQNECFCLLVVFIINLQ